MALIDDLQNNGNAGPNPILNMPGLPPIAGAPAPPAVGLPPIGQQANLNPMPPLPGMQTAQAGGATATVPDFLKAWPQISDSNQLNGPVKNIPPFNPISTPSLFGSPLGQALTQSNPMTELQQRLAQAANTHQGLTHYRNPAGPWTGPAHKGFWDHLARIGEGIGNVAGDVFAPSTMMLIPGTQLNREITAKEGQEQLAGIQKGETDYAEAAARMATANAELDKAKNGGDIKPLEGQDLSYPDPKDSTKTITYPAAYRGTNIVPMLPPGVIAPSGTPTIVPSTRTTTGTKTPLEQVQQQLIGLDENSPTYKTDREKLLGKIAEIEHVAPLTPYAPSKHLVDLDHDPTHPKGQTYPLGHTEDGRLVAITPWGAVPAPEAEPTGKTAKPAAGTAPPVKPNPPNAGVSLNDFGGGFPGMPGTTGLPPANATDAGFSNPIAPLFNPKPGLPQIGGVPPIAGTPPITMAAGQMGAPAHSPGATTENQRLTELDRESAALRTPFQKALDAAGSKFDRIQQTRNSIAAGYVGQGIGIPELLTALVSGQGTGVRITQAELNMVTKNRGIVGNAISFLNTMAGKGNLTDTDKKQINEILDAAQSRLEEKQEMENDTVNAIDTAENRDDMIKATERGRNWLLNSEKYIEIRTMPNGDYVASNDGGKTIYDLATGKIYVPPKEVK